MVLRFIFIAQIYMFTRKRRIITVLLGFTLTYVGRWGKF